MVTAESAFTQEHCDEFSNVLYTVYEYLFAPEDAQHA